MDKLREVHRRVSGVGKTFLEKIGVGPYRTLRTAILSGDDLKAHRAYNSTDKNGQALTQELQPSLPFPGFEETDNGCTPLHFAAAQAMKDLLVAFLERGGYPNATNGRQQTALHFVCGAAYSPTLDHDAEQGAFSGRRQPLLRAPDRLVCLDLLLQWRASFAIDGETERMAVNSVDELGNSALHYAAELGLALLVDKLLVHGAILTLVNKAQETPCDVAIRCGHEDLASRLELTMLFMGETDETQAILESGNLGSGGEAPDHSMIEPDETAGTHDGGFGITVLRDSSMLKERRRRETRAAAKLGLSIEDTSMLLSYAGWDVSGLQHAWFELGLALELSNAAKIDFRLATNPSKSDDSVWNEAYTCPICFESFAAMPNSERIWDSCVPCSEQTTVAGQDEDLSSPVTAETRFRIPCGHRFCSSCWKGYIMTALDGGTLGGGICCPMDKCRVPVPRLIIETVLDEDAKKAWHRQMSDTFVLGAEDIRYCPRAGCGAAVSLHLPIDETVEAPEKAGPRTQGMERLSLHAAYYTQGCIRRASKLKNEPDERNKVDANESSKGDESENLGRARDNAGPPVDVSCTCLTSFCFGCGLAPHFPLTCSEFVDWTSRIEGERRKLHKERGLDGADAASSQDIANKMWLIANTKQCPRCKTPIEKNEGCNHMTCSNKGCRHEFCWICMQDWSLHGQRTGGYFRCNRFLDENLQNVPGGTEGGAGSAEEEGRRMRNQARKMARLIHHFTRYVAHEESQAQEVALQEQTLTRIRRLQQEAYSRFETPDEEAESAFDQRLQGELRSIASQAESESRASLMWPVKEKRLPPLVLRL